MGLMAETFICRDNECNYEEDVLLDREDRDKARECPACSGPSYRGFTCINVRTPKTSASFLDGTKRFSQHKKALQMKRDLSAARVDLMTNDSKSNRAAEREVSKEQRKLSKSMKARKE